MKWKISVLLAKSWLRDLQVSGSVRWLAVFLMAVTLLDSAGAVAQTQGKAMKPEIHRALPLSSFYDTPNPLPAGKPGELIRSQPAEDYALPPGVAAVRILYHSRSATGEDVAASGVVLIPGGRDGRLPAAGRSLPGRTDREASLASAHRH